MKPQISRREFFNALVPRWATKRNLIVGAFAAGVTAAVALVISLVREMGFVNFLKVVLVGLGFVGLRLALSWIGEKLRYLFTISPPLLQAIVIVTLQFLGGAALCAVGVYAYTRWQTTGELATPLMMLIPPFVASVWSEWRKRSKTPTAESAAATRSSAT